MALSGLQAPPGFYERLWTPLLTLWYLIWQCLQPGHTLEKVIADARRGGADGLCRPGKRLSQALRSRATTAYSKARQRLPLDWVRHSFHKLAAVLLTLTPGAASDLPVELLDGSTKRLRPYGNISQQFPAHRTRRRKPYWCIARVLARLRGFEGVVARKCL